MTGVAPAGGARPRRRLFWKYVAVLVTLVTVLLAASASVELWFSYEESKRALVALQREKAGAAAARIEAFIREIERQMAWTTLPLLASGEAALEQRRLDFVRLQRQVPPITDLSHLDADGKEQLRISRLTMDVTGGGTDYATDPRFTEARAQRVYHGPVYFRKESEPYMVIAMAQSGGGVTVAEVNLKFIWDVVTQIRIGKAGRAYVVDGGGTLIAHPDISLVLQKTSLTGLSQVAAARQPGGAEVAEARDAQGRRVLTASASIPGLRWIVFAEQPLEEAMAPLEASLTRALALLAVGVGLALVASVMLARRMVRPIQALQASAARIGGGELGHDIDLRTGDELEALAREFNRMTGALRESYATLEQRVEDRTRELREALERQSATAEILRVISRSPTDVQPVFDAIVRSAVRLCDANDATLWRFDGRRQHLVAHANLPPDVAELLRTRSAVSPEEASVTGRAILTREIVHVPDFEAETRFPLTRAVVHPSDVRSVLAVPMLRETECFGIIVVTRGLGRPRPYTAMEIEMLQTFADQAVIAIDNVRLFNELQDRNAALSETLEQQTATAEILRVISESRTDAQPVFDVIARRAVELCAPAFGGVLRYDGRLAHLAASANIDPVRQAAFDRIWPTTPRGLLTRALTTGEPVHAHDVREEPPLEVSEAARTLEYRTALIVPMVREHTAIGAIVVARGEVRPFSPKQVELLRTFADQAAIAIENVRLLQEVQARNADLTETLEQQTATAEILRVISSSPTDVQPVLDVVAENAAKVCGAIDAVILRVEGDHMRRVAHFGPLPAGMPAAEFRPVNRNSAAGRAVLDRRSIQVADMLDPAAAEEFPEGALLARRSGDRTILATPLVREDVAIGVIIMRRREPRAFDDKQVALLQTFADQAVIAIENVRLFTELQERTAQLQVASRHKDEFLANMSHELRTPLNAVIGFSEVLLERMFGDLNDKQAEYLADILSSGRHLLSLINDILDLSKIEAGRMDLEVAEFDLPTAIENALTLVHERAARRGLVLERDIDPGLGAFRGDERKIKQVLLNLLSNAIKFTNEGGRVQVRAALKGEVVEIAVADTGIGIKPEDQEAVFEEFRQVGNDLARKHEGTGLGLALARRFVELHGGNLWLDSEVGAGSTFTFALPVRR